MKCFVYFFKRTLKTKFDFTYYQKARPQQCRIQGIGLLIGLCMILPILWSQYIVITRQLIHTHTHIDNRSRQTTYTSRARLTQIVVAAPVVREYQVYNKEFSL
jgi:hypothetical protein